MAEHYSVSTQLPVYSTIVQNWENFGLKEKIVSYRTENPESTNDYTNVDAWHSGWDLHKLEDFKSFADVICNLCIEIVGDCFGKFVPLKIIEMWAMQYEVGDSAKRHNHYPADISCSYYVDVEDGCSPIIFEDSIEIIPKNGMLVLFPSFVNHKVLSTNKKRTVISFNLAKHLSEPRPISPELSSLLGNLNDMFI